MSDDVEQGTLDATNASLIANSRIKREREQTEAIIRIEKKLDELIARMGALIKR